MMMTNNALLPPSPASYALLSRSRAWSEQQAHAQAATASKQAIGALLPLIKQVRGFRGSGFFGVRGVRGPLALVKEGRGSCVSLVSFEPIIGDRQFVLGTDDAHDPPRFAALTLLAPPIATRLLSPPSVIQIMIFIPI